MMSGEYLSVISRRLPSIRSVSQQMFEFEHKIYYSEKPPKKTMNIIFITKDIKSIIHIKLFLYKYFNINSLSTFKCVSSH